MDQLSNDINRVFSNAKKVMEDSKYQIYEICDSARKEYAALQKELDAVIEETIRVIDQVDKLDQDYRYARIRLTEVSRDFNRFGEFDIKRAYEKATLLQLEITTLQEKEKYLKSKRDDLQIRVRNVEKNIERAEIIASQMNVILEYLSGDLNQVTRIIESAKNRQLIGLKIILAQEEERKRVARDIHDGPAQTLANLVLRTEIVERMLYKEHLEQVKYELVDLREQVKMGLEEIRKTIFNLRPMALDDLGLIPTLRKLTQDFEEKHLIHSVLEVLGKELRVDSSMEAAMYRLVQEALSNVAKHAEATHVQVSITYADDSIEIKVNDNGKGFKYEPTQNVDRESTHFGILGMIERVELLEGTLQVNSQIGRGTEIHIIIPINKS